MKTNLTFPIVVIGVGVVAIIATIRAAQNQIEEQNSRSADETAEPAEKIEKPAPEPEPRGAEEPRRPSIPAEPKGSGPRPRPESRPATDPRPEPRSERREDFRPEPRPERREEPEPEPRSDEDPRQTPPENSGPIRGSSERLDNIVVVTVDNFNDIVIDGETPVLVDFWAPWCGACKAIEPRIEAVAEEFAGDLIVAKINVDESPELADHLRIRGLPTLMLFIDGRPVETMVGAVSERELSRAISRNID